MDERPIGIFDSGLGGLTAAKALEEILPGENLIYFGDSANAPYGTRAREELAQLAFANASFLQGFDCKAILVACGTVSTNAMDVLRSRFPVPFFDVLNAACDAAARQTKTKRVAVIATEATIKSGAFERKLRLIDSSLEVFSKPCQSLVTVTEQGHFVRGDSVAAAAVKEELAPVKAWTPDILIMACTHFPLLQDIISDEMGDTVTLLSVGAETAKALKAFLSDHNLLSGRATGARRWFTSGDPEAFSAHAEIFLGHGVCAEAKRGGDTK